jgi:hypothetical protein
VNRIRDDAIRGRLDMPLDNPFDTAVDVELEQRSLDVVDQHLPDLLAVER